MVEMAQLAAPQPPTLCSSHAVSSRCALGTFDKFIKQNADGSWDVRGLISRACYREWISTRLRPPRNPAEAFRKAITSHCRGDEGMAPFEPEVEKAVLELLRRKKIWPCFQGTDKKIGSRGFQAVGYWEKGGASNESTSKKRKIEIKKEEIMTLYRQPFIEGRQFKVDLPFFMSKIYQDNQKLCGIGNTFSRLSLVENTNSDPLDQLSNAQVAFITDTFRTLIKKEKGVLQETLETYLDFVGEQMEPIYLIKLYRQVGLEVFYPRRIPDKLYTDDKTRIFFSRDFILPPKDEQRFFECKIKGLLICDPMTLSPLEMNEASEKIYRGSILGITSFKLRVHKAQSCLYVKEALREYVDKGEVWTRSVEYRIDGTIMVLLNRYRRCDYDLSLCEVTFQDVTDEYYHLL